MRGDEMSDHHFEVRQERGGLIYEPVCTAPPDSPCNTIIRRDVLEAEMREPYEPNDPGACMLVDWLNCDPGLIPELCGTDFKIARVPFIMESFGGEDDAWMPALPLTQVTDET